MVQRAFAEITYRFDGTEGVCWDVSFPVVGVVQEVAVGRKGQP